MSFPHRSQIESFRFTQCRFDFSTMTAVLSYAFDDKAFFDETFVFYDVPAAVRQREETVNAVLRLLHFAAGVSYYKAFLPEKIFVETAPMSRNEALFFKNFYENGLGEFAYKNRISPVLNFPFDVREKTAVQTVMLSKKTVVPVGGGKDSIVTTEVLKKAGFSPVLISVNQPRPIQETIALSGCSAIQIRRIVSPVLTEMNARARDLGVLNGHVPVTGILAFALALAAVLYDFSDVVMSNERSANVGNTDFQGRIVNHQWSKSSEFERDFAALIKTVLPNFSYFSFLRPLSELAIAKNFAATQIYDAVFTSCNKAFRLDETKRIDRWCGNCDKCRFVFLALAAFMDKQRLLNIFKCNPLNDASQTDGFKRLLGLEAFKPFECVGEIEESACAFSVVKNKPEWQNDAVVKALASHALPAFDTAKIFALSSNHLVPPEYENAFAFFEK